MVETPRAAAKGPLDSAAHLAVLDGLRGIAIFVVLWYHVWEWNWLAAEFHAFGRTISLQFIAETGFTGVDLFFFISGFVLFYPYARALFEGAPLQTVAHYAYRRFIKIVPSYYLQLLILTPWIVAAFSGATLLKVYVTHLLFIHNWFRDTFGSVNGVLWTLAVEVQFYVIFPLLCWAFRRRPFLTFAAILVIANGYRILRGHCCLGDYVVMTQMPAFLDLFASGMLAAWLFVWLRTHVAGLARWQHWLTVVAVAGFVCYGVLLYSQFKLRVVPNWQYVWANGHMTLLGATFIVLTVASCLAASWWRALLANRLLVFLSVISYNLYLWHQLIATFIARHALPFPRTADFASDRVWQWTYLAETVAISIAVASLITYAFERPLLKRGFKAVTDLFSRRWPPAPARANGRPSPVADSPQTRA
ncbi:MAG: acyltransferase [Candidatus Eremiobacteraeota bacterium]|nr:acyltransferase [Candidatus Eremiobacteraeota bacterium]MBV8366433.1 acyltransferase [Candidatus Eremiobacteraeota bacterium]